MSTSGGQGCGVVGGIRSCSLGKESDRIKATRPDEEKIGYRSVEGCRQHDSIMFTIETPRTTKKSQ